MTAERYRDWPEGLVQDMQANSHNGCVGSVLVSETDRVRVWHLHLGVGKRCAFHRHVLHYFWTCHSHGRARGYFEDGSIRDVTHFPGDTKHFEFPKDAYLLHCVENIGDTDLLFTTVELKNQSQNEPLPIPDSVRLTIAG